jgi:hypothetical protein
MEILFAAVRQLYPLGSLAPVVDGDAQSVEDCLLRACDYPTSCGFSEDGEEESFSEGG